MGDAVDSSTTTPGWSATKLAVALPLFGSAAEYVVRNTRWARAWPSEADGTTATATGGDHLASGDGGRAAVIDWPTVRSSAPGAPAVDEAPVRDLAENDALPRRPTAPRQAAVEAETWTSTQSAAASEPALAGAGAGDDVAPGPGRGDSAEPAASGFDAPVADETGPRPSADRLVLGRADPAATCGLVARRAESTTADVVAASTRTTAQPAITCRRDRRRSRAASSSARAARSAT